MLIFAIGARVFWKRPDDESTQLFFAVCIVTVGAFMGGYHWTEIVTEPWLIYPFALVRGVRAGGQSAFLPGLSAGQSGSGAAQAAGAGALYGITTGYLLALWASMLAARWFSFHAGWLADCRGLSGLALAGAGIHRPGGVPLTGSASTAWSSVTGTRRPAASATRCAGSCGRR